MQPYIYLSVPSTNAASSWHYLSGNGLHSKAHLKLLCWLWHPMRFLSLWFVGRDVTIWNLHQVFAEGALTSRCSHGQRLLLDVAVKCVQAGYGYVTMLVACTGSTSCVTGDEHLSLPPSLSLIHSQTSYARSTPWSESYSLHANDIADSKHTRSRAVSSIQTLHDVLRSVGK